MRYDYIVVGAGTAGCVVAARLSERPDCRVLLAEAGPDIVPEPPSITSPYPVSHGVAAFRWPGMVAAIKAPQAGEGEAVRRPYMQARVVGGGGSLMGMIALRGTPADYDEWRDGGAAGWGWDDVLPSFRRLERDLDFDGPMHGHDGPIPIRRYARRDWSPFAEAMGKTFETGGFPFIADANGDFRDGHLAIPTSSLPMRRMSSAAGFLNAAVRSRKNLTILTDTEVTGILIENRRATGIAVSNARGPVLHYARTVVVCAGALHTPQLLLRSGIGPGEELKKIGLEPIVDLPGVGRNLYNHPAIYLSALLPRAYRRRGGPFIYNALRYSSGLVDCPAHDMLMPVINRTAWHALGERIVSLGVCVYKTLSRGRISLARKDGRFTSDIELGMFADPRDLIRLTSGFRRVSHYFAQAAKALPGLTIFAPTNMQLLARLAEPRLANRALAWLMAAILDGPAPVRRRALRQAGVDPLPFLQDEDRLTAFVYRLSSPMFHPAGTCRIGAPGDRGAVVDPRCRVIGVDGLCVADASLMPSIIRGNTNIPTLMIGEKAAAMIREDEATDASARV